MAVLLIQNFSINNVAVTGMHTLQHFAENSRAGITMQYISTFSAVPLFPV
jgi:hypothetical protein